MQPFNIVEMEAFVKLNLIKFDGIRIFSYSCLKWFVEIGSAKNTRESCGDLRLQKQEPSDAELSEKLAPLLFMETQLSHPLPLKPLEPSKLYRIEGFT